MYYEGGKYHPSHKDLADRRLACPTCSGGMDAKQTVRWAGYACAMCNASITLADIEGLPEEYREVFISDDEFVSKVESLKDIVDELQGRGATDDAYALANLVTSMLPESEITLPANVIEACRLLDLAEAKVGDLPQAARISSARLDIQRRWKQGEKNGN